MAAYYIECEFDTLEDGVVTSTETVRLLYTDKTCADEEAVFTALTTKQQMEDMRATMSTAVPSPPTGYTASAISRNCSPSSGPQIVVQGSNAGYTPDPTTTPPDPNPPTTTTDGFDTSYQYSKVGQDVFGNAMVDDPAPILTARVDRSKPRLNGNNFTFPSQQAINTVLWDRFPAFTIHAKKRILWPGQLFTDPALNTLMTRGWTHLSESSKPPSNDTRSYRRGYEEANYYLAKRAAERQGVNPAYAQKLLEWSNTTPDFSGRHLLLDDEEAAKLYAKEWYDELKTRGDADYFSINHEVFEARDNGVGYYTQWYTHVGWLAKWIIGYARQDGNADLKCVITDWGNFAAILPQAFDFLASQSEFGGRSDLPAYMDYHYVGEPYNGGSTNAPLGNWSDLGKLFKSGDAYAGLQSYMKFTYDDESFFEKWGDGSYKTDGSGSMIYRTAQRTITMNGQTSTVVSIDAKMAVEQMYVFAARFVTHIFFLSGGKDLPMSTDRQAGYENSLLTSAFRLDGELPGDFTGLSPDDMNARVLNDDLTELHAIMMYTLTDYIRGWMAFINPQVAGSNPGGKSLARASGEIYTKGFYRAASELNWINDTPWQLLQPRHFILQQGMVGPANPDEQYWKKPLVYGGLATYQNKPTIWLVACYVAQDTDKHTDMVLWANKAGNPSPGYVIRLNGREPFVESFELPSAQAGVTPGEIFLQFTDMVGEKQTWDMDYRTSKITVHPNPPAAA